MLIGLEIPRWLNEDIGAFVDGRIGPDLLLVDEYWQREIQDGRQSRGMLDLLRRLGEVVAMDRKVETRGFDDAEMFLSGHRSTRATN